MTKPYWKMYLESKEEGLSILTNSLGSRNGIETNTGNQNLAGQNTMYFPARYVNDANVVVSPEPTHMLPYKPKVNALPEDHPIPGGTFPMSFADVQMLPQTQNLYPYLHGKTLEMYYEKYLSNKASSANTENDNETISGIRKEGQGEASEESDEEDSLGALP